MLAVGWAGVKGCIDGGAQGNCIYLTTYLTILPTPVGIRRQDRLLPSFPRKRESRTVLP